MSERNNGKKTLDVEGTAGAAINQDTYQVVLPFFFFFSAKLSLATGAMKEILGKIQSDIDVVFLWEFC